MDMRGLGRTTDAIMERCANDGDAEQLKYVECSPLSRDVRVLVGFWMVFSLVV